MPTIELDRTDCRILELLQANGRLSNVELAEKVALSPSPCLRRLKRLETAGVIRRYVALVEPAKVGLGLLAFVRVSLEKRGRGAMDAFKRAVQEWPEVMDCYVMTGDVDYLLKILVEDLEHFSRFMMDRLLKQPGVIDAKSSFALETLKDNTALDLAHLRAANAGPKTR
jgi:Lrp/AsnC family transcriptional regulator, leucine-responsive regulatory protein